ncbi:hypothetical protein [Pedobacter frigoris]|uniref:Uncharacterized protein n=1 Tax=Pedobacter frigoris TaxID=2571272 RepID=A0A4U1CH76_9SPHI|nr:hypothetical protein [Pedobacter frigoris]TKC05242.1 hypothetical protein FA047_15920 [Pedobacter frigoris]
MKKYLLTMFFALAVTDIFSQIHTDQNGLKTTVINNIQANEAQARRYEVATIGYNSHHWQFGGVIVIELFQHSFQTGYEKYILENGHGQGANSGSAVLKLVESDGIGHNAKVTLGTPYDLGTNYSDKANMGLPVYVDVRFYTNYKVKITYLQNRVETVNDQNQIKINTSPIGVNIDDFIPVVRPSKDLVTIGNLKIKGNGLNYIEEGTLGIGTTDTKGYKLAVAGNVIAESVKVKLQGAWPDYVFTPSYKVPTLQETEKHIKDKGHLPGIPSASEVKANGVDLGDMNAKLLQKIEELTLHLIEKNKQLQEQKLLNNNQEDRLRKLEMTINKK